MYKLSFFQRVNTSIYYTFERRKTIINRSSSRGIYSESALPLSRIIRIKYDTFEGIWDVGHTIENILDDVAAIVAIQRFISKITDRNSHYLCVLLSNYVDGIIQTSSAAKVPQAQVVVLLDLHTGLQSPAKPGPAPKPINWNAIPTPSCSNLLTSVKSSLLLINPVEPHLLLMAIFLKSSGNMNEPDQYVQYLLTQLNPKFILREFKSMLQLITDYCPDNISKSCESVFSQIRNNDRAYFFRKMRIFDNTIKRYKNRIADLPELAQAYAVFLAELIAQAKKEYTVEAITLCSHFKNYPHELIHLRKELGRQPYLDMLSFSHQHVSEKKPDGGQRLSYQLMLSSITVTSEHDHVNYGFALKIREIILSRDEVLGPMYQQHLRTLRRKIPPKNKCYENYYPFKVFAGALVLFEHILHSIPA